MARRGRHQSEDEKAAAAAAGAAAAASQNPEDPVVERDEPEIETDPEPEDERSLEEITPASEPRYDRGIHDPKPRTRETKLYRSRIDGIIAGKLVTKHEVIPLTDEELAGLADGTVVGIPEVDWPRA